MDITNINDIIKIISVLIFPVLGFMFRILLKVQDKTIELEQKNKDLELKIHDKFIKKDDIILLKSDITTRFDQVADTMQEKFNLLFKTLENHDENFKNINRILMERK